ncbi:MAG: hypothetical protein AAF723_02625, partial [Pseudomonadota bacterium]
GLLSKYAMIYFFVGWGGAILISAAARKSLKPLPLLGAAVVAASFFTPNLLWNAENGFQTLSHTADNANWGRQLLNPGELWAFFSAQFGVAGPILFSALLVGVATLKKRQHQAGGEAPKDLMLLAFILPPLIIICIQALLSRAHANWAMTAYPAAMILLPAWWGRTKARWVMPASLGLHSSVGLLFIVVLLNFVVADSLNLSNSVKRLRGWDVQAAQILGTAQVEKADAILFDEREIAAHMVWEWRQKPPQIMVYDLNGRPDNTYEYEFPFIYEQGKQYLLATQVQDLCLYNKFTDIKSVGTSFVDLKASRHGRPERTIDLYILSGFDASRPVDCSE